MITHRQALPRDQKSSKKQVGSARQGYCHDHYSDSALDNLAQQQSAPKSQCEQPRARDSRLRSAGEPSHSVFRDRRRGAQGVTGAAITARR